MVDRSKLNVHHRTYAVSRAGAPDADYEDSARVAADSWPVTAAVADGATETVFSGRWADLLVDGVIAENTPSVGGLGAVVSAAQASWRAHVSEETEERPWYVATKAMEGAYATLLGLSVESNGEWRAIAVGDCCLFHVREDQLQFSWPYDSAEPFDDRPELIPSRSRLPVPTPRTTAGRWTPGDVFFLATDALAAWILDRGVADLSSISQAEFLRIVESARSDGALRNDDVTLITLQVQ